ncbi:MAG: hypothetical protein J6R82_02540 [Clostridia bacterium]|nr:hypothetical protein [Clostridia bacterium]
MNNFINQIKPLFPVTYNKALVDKLLSALKIEFKNPQAWLPMVIQIVLYVLADAVAGIVLGIVGGIVAAILPPFAFFFGTLGTIVGIYTLCGIVLSVCDFLKLFEPKEATDSSEEKNDQE